MAESEEELQSHLTKVKKESEKTGLKLKKKQQQQQLRSWYVLPSLHDKQIGKQWNTLFSWAQKSLQMVTAAINLKDACSL